MWSSFMVWLFLCFLFCLIQEESNNFSISLESISQCLLSICAGFGLVLGVGDWAIKGRKLSSLLRCFKKMWREEDLYIEKI